MDFKAEAELFFRKFARRNRLDIEQQDDFNMDLLMTVSRQPGLSFDLTLGLQNGDEINIGFEGFWSYIFPFREARDRVDQWLDGIVSGLCRLACHMQFGRVVKRVLESKAGTGWKPVYSAHSSFSVPFMRTEVSYVRNVDAR